MATSSRVRVSMVLAAGLGLSPLALIGACESEETPEVSFHADIRPLIQEKCAVCHFEGGPAPFTFSFDPSEWEDGPAPWVAKAVEEIEAGTMPPWMPAKGCKDLANDRSLSEDDHALIQRWKELGFPEGNAEDYVEPASQASTLAELGDPTLDLASSKGYVPTTYNGADDYRCFLLDADFPEEAYVISTHLRPGVTALAHHALLYVIPDSGVAEITAMEAEDDIPGYECFGGPGGGGLTTLGGWAPGGTQTRTPEDSAMVVPAGSKLVLQMHYNTLSFAADEEIPSDVSHARVWLQTEKPKYRVESLPMAHLTMEIEAGNPSSVEERAFKMPTDGIIIGNAPHMHVLGQSISARFEGQDGQEQCMVHIPNWNFHWQGGYGFPKEGWIDAKKGDTIHLTCTYDNSAAAQQIVNGQKIMPRDVYWGEGTLDEMCLNYIAVLTPFDAPDYRCGAYDPCMESCAEGDANCFFACATEGGGQCAACVIDQFVACGSQFCVEQGGIDLYLCMDACELDSAACLNHRCNAEFNAFYACTEQHVRAGECAAGYATCGIDTTSQL